MDDVGVLAALHGGADDVLKVLVGDEFDLDAGGLGEGRADVGPHLSAVGGLDGRYLDGAGGLDNVAAVVRSGAVLSGGRGGISGGRAAGGKDAQGKHENEYECKEFLHFHSSFLKIRGSLNTMDGASIPVGLSIIFPESDSIK